MDRWAKNVLSDYYNNNDMVTMTPIAFQQEEYSWDNQSMERYKHLELSQDGAKCYPALQKNWIPGWHVSREKIVCVLENHLTSHKLRLVF